MRKYTLPLCTFLIITLLQAIPTSAQAQSITPTCPQGYFLQNGRCHPTCVGDYCDTYQRRAPVYVNGPTATGEKSVALAFLLEFLIGFGTGHYYAGNDDWAMVGLLSGVAMYGGVFYLVDSVSSGSGGNIAIPITLIVLGAMGKLTSAIAAPIVTAQKNKERVMNYYGGQALADADPFKLDLTGRGDFKAGPVNPPGSSGAGIFLPVLSLSF